MVPCGTLWCGDSPTLAGPHLIVHRQAVGGASLKPKLGSANRLLMQLSPQLTHGTLPALEAGLAMLHLLSSDNSHPCECGLDGRLWSSSLKLCSPGEGEP